MKEDCFFATTKVIFYIVENYLLHFYLGHYRIKVVLADKKRTNKWLSEQLECAPTTVSKWCTNASQPPMETFVKIAEILEVDINELLRIEKK